MSVFDSGYFHGFISLTTTLRFPGSVRGISTLRARGAGFKRCQRHTGGRHDDACR